MICWNQIKPNAYLVQIKDTNGIGGLVHQCQRSSHCCFGRNDQFVWLLVKLWLVVVDVTDGHCDRRGLHWSLVAYFVSSHAELKQTAESAYLVRFQIDALFYENIANKLVDLKVLANAIQIGYYFVLARVVYACVTVFGKYAQNKRVLEI